MSQINSLKDYQTLIKQFPVLTPEEEYELALRGDKESKEKIINSNLRLVIPWAYHFKGQGVEIEDLISEGNMGLMRAADKFIPEKGNKFCTYAAWWIKQYMVRAIENQSQSIRVPSHMKEDIEKIKLAIRDLFPILGRTPTDEEIAEKTGLTQKRVKEATSYIIEMMPLDKPVGDEDDVTIGDLIEDEKFINPEDSYLKEDTKEVLIAVLETLSDRECQIIKLRYGLDSDGISHSLEDIGKILHLSKERVRQVEAIASRKLRNPIRLNVLKEYL